MKLRPTQRLTDKNYISQLWQWQCSYLTICTCMFTFRFSFVSYLQNHDPLTNIETQIMMKVTSVCLQLLCKHSWLGSKKYLRVTPGGSSWLIHYTVDGRYRGWIQSASAGGVSPADPSSGKSDRLGWNGWRYWDGGWKNGDITVDCVYKA